MSKLFWRLSIGLVLGLIGVACTNNDPTIEKSEIEIDTASAQVFSFDSSTDGFNTDRFGASSIELADGAYQLTSFSETGNHYLVGQNPDIALKNVVIEVTINPIAGQENNWFGVVCRTNVDDTGYALLISSDGFWSIAEVKQSGNRQFLEYLRQWRENDNIRKDGPNTLMAYCVEDYLALYVNNEFLGDYQDSSLDRVGGVGFLAGGAQDDQVIVAFEDARVSSAARRGRPNTPAPTLETLPEVTIEPIEVPALETTPTS